MAPSVAERVDELRREIRRLDHLYYVEATPAVSDLVYDKLLEELKLLANKKDVPYQSLIKVFLAERIRRELKKDAA